MRRKLLALGTVLVLASLGVAGGAALASSSTGPLAYTGPTQLATGNAAPYTATLTGATGAISGAAVTFTLANQAPVTATTDATGTAAATQEVLKAAGQYLLTVSSPGVPDAVVRFNVSPPGTDVANSIASTKGAGEPSITSSPDGTLYTSALASGTTLLRSADGGTSWQKPKTVPFASSGDSTVGTDASGSVYLSSLDLANTNGPLQIYLYKSGNHGDGPWAPGHGPVLGSNSTNQPFLVDRQWIDSYIPPGSDTAHSRVYITYHDWAPNQIWVNTSTDGGANFGPPMDVISSPLAEADSFCNTIPGGVKVVQTGPHAGRVYVAWLAGDPVFNVATGCNATQMQTFHTVWVAWSDNADAQVPTWTDQLVYDGGIGHDAGSIFADLALDTAGNPYISFAMNLLSEWDVFVEASFDNGATWNGKTDGSGAPYKVNLDTGTHYFPAIAVGDPGRVDVVYLRTQALVPTIPTGKGAGSGFDENATWKIYAAQSLDLNLGSPTWTVTDVKPAPMHKGDICNLGIFCGILPGAPGDRSLADFIDIAVDPAGYFHASYTDNFGHSAQLHVANQVAGPSAYAAPAA
jgi:hypothetical protein